MIDEIEIKNDYILIWKLMTWIEYGKVCYTVVDMYELYISYLFLNMLMHIL